MPYFSYKGRNQKGVLVQGVLESLNSQSLASHLLNENITPVEIKASKAPNNPEKNEIQFFKEKVETLDVMMFSQQMYTLLKAGIPIMTALTGLEASTKNKAFAKIIADIRESLDSGRELSAAMQAHPAVFSNFYISMVRVGETTGLLETIFLRMFSHLEFERFMRDQIKSALRYPTFVMIAMAAAIVVVNLFVIPAFSKVFETMGSDLPFLTHVLLDFSHFMQHYWYLILIALMAIFFGLRQWTSTKEGKLKWDTIKLKIPIAGKIIHKGTLARFARSYSLACKSGVPVTQALKLVSRTADNQFISEKIDQMCTGVERGESILRSATNTGVFNPIVLQMIAVGEESGALDDLMAEVADMYQRDVEYEIKTLGAQIEPIMILFLGALVLILALGIFLPIWDLGNVALHKK